ncbi:NYN domain-containing protein [Nocardioides mesophilus]|uniref:NYN domain-containing protein n=1 Tax=Nocardioides mesophilus TaxID=433659 RepID=A0A7G9RC46_9ACTN|nr:NYN domain-containing protein [Nocardioides mesophilus]QNN53171.1 NYN domain-containing protein [Nocardioides mesophilus]
MSAGEAAEGSSGADVSPLLPGPVRVRVIALAADALGNLPAEQLPAPLKRVASFASSRRAKLAGAQIASVLETDERFRDRVATLVRPEVTGLVDALEAGDLPAAADPVELAAVAFLFRPDGWQQIVESAVSAVVRQHESASSRQAEEQIERLKAQVETAHEESRSSRSQHREEVARLKADNSALRHKLGDARMRLKEAEEEAARAQDEAMVARRGVSSAAAAGEAEARRLRSRVEELEGELAGLRRAERAGRGQETLRARLLLDTLLETAQGLRRELALPAVEGSPADLVEAHVAEQGSRVSTAHGSMAVDDPALLEQLLTMPRMHLIIDGYNVTKSAYPELSLEKQRDRLMSRLAPLAARSGGETTVVFDAADKTERPLVNRPRHVRVLFSPVGVIADDVIRELVAAEPTGRPVVVVTSDQAVVRDVVRAGARAVAAAALSRLLARA